MCRLAEKAYRQQHRLYIHAQSSAEAQLLDDRLWDYSPTSFLPHEPLGDDPSDRCPIFIGHTEQQASACAGQRILINLNTELPAAHSDYVRVIEIAHQDPPLLAALRRHYAQLQAAGFDMKTHNFVKERPVSRIGATSSERIGV